jgi:hypothetical protein
MRSVLLEPSNDVRPVMTAEEILDEYTHSSCPRPRPAGAPNTTQNDGNHGEGKRHIGTYGSARDTRNAVLSAHSDRSDALFCAPLLGGLGSACSPKPCRRRDHGAHRRGAEVFAARSEVPPRFAFGDGPPLAV